MSPGTSIESVETVAPLLQAGALAASYQEHVLAWQREAIRIVFAQVALLQTGALTLMRAVVQFPHAAADRERERYIGLTDMWLRLSSELQLALFHSLSPLPMISELRPRDIPIPDRRVESVVIDFPDRRAAA